MHTQTARLVKDLVQSVVLTVGLSDGMVLYLGGSVYVPKVLICLKFEDSFTNFHCVIMYYNVM